MSKVALVSHDVQTIRGRAGGVGAFVTHFARLLRDSGDEVTIILTRQETFPVEIDESWRRKFADWGIEILEFHNAEPSPDRWSQPWADRLSELVAPRLADFDIAYFQDWANVAFRTARLKRFSAARMPVLVTVLHGPSAWVRMGNQRQPEVPEDLDLNYIERYSARHSDFVVSPSRYMATWLRTHGWDFGPEPLVLGLPMLVPERPISPASVPSGETRRLVFFGRLETRKGFSLFVSALRLLFEQTPSALQGVGEIILLGEEQEAGSVEKVRRELAALDIPILHQGSFNSDEAQAYLAQHTADSLVVVPSPAENFPYAVIEACSIPGINLLCSNGGGVPEVLDGRGTDHLFAPYPASLAAKLRERLADPSLAAGLPVYDAAAANARWLEFHRQALRRATPPAAIKAPATVDVCIPYFNKATYFPHLLTALENQTRGDFGLIAVDDGSEAAQKATFDQLRARYGERGWTFVTQTNSFVDAARNRAASLSKADYLFFIDADDIPAPHAIERMLEAITLSGDDCLVAGGLMVGDEVPLDLDTAPILARYLPLGPDLVSGLVNPMVLGPSMILIRRSAFEAIGGYRTVHGAAHEDWELQIRLLMAGFRVDVLPEYLLYFRKTASGLSLTSSEYAAKQRLIDTYEVELAKVGLHGMAATLIALLKRREELELALRERMTADTRRLHGLVGEMLRRRATGS